MESKEYIGLTEIVFVSIDSIGFVNKGKKFFEFHKSGRLPSTTEIFHFGSAALSSRIEFASSLCDDDVA